VPANPAGGQRPIVRSSTPSQLRRTPTCGYVDNASALPTYPQDQKTTKSKRQFDCFGSTAVRPGPSQPRPSARAAATLATVFGIYPGRHSHLPARAVPGCVVPLDPAHLGLEPVSPDIRTGLCPSEGIAPGKTLARPETRAAFLATPADSGRQRPRSPSPAAKPRKVKGYSERARKPELRGTAWWGW
jgi:hypothetical protein